MLFVMLLTAWRPLNKAQNLGIRAAVLTTVAVSILLTCCWWCGWLYLHVAEGDHDYVVPYQGTRAWVYDLGLKQAKTWHSWSLPGDDQVQTRHQQHVHRHVGGKSDDHAQLQASLGLRRRAAHPSMRDETRYLKMHHQWRLVPALVLAHTHTHHMAITLLSWQCLSHTLQTHTVTHMPNAQLSH